MPGLGLARRSATKQRMPAFTRTAQPSPGLRRQYLASLDAAQELFLEEMVQAGQVWTHQDGSYAITKGQSLVEFVSADPGNTTALLDVFKNLRLISTALVKSYDHALRRSCAQLGWLGTVGGVLFRKRVARGQVAFDGAKLTATASADVAALWAMSDGFFDSKDEVARLARSNKLWTAKLGDTIAGCGLANRIFPDTDAVDVGMLVAPTCRRKGLGTYIVSAISDRLEGEGLRPICGCGASNAASKATLEKAGFVSEHQLLSFAI